MKYINKFIPVEPYEIAILENWFSNLSAEGLHLHSTNTFFASFEKKEPKRMIYRMEPKKEGFGDKPPQKQMELYQEYGWEFVSIFGKYFYIYAAEEGTMEIHTDPVVESSLYKEYSKQTDPLSNSLLLSVLIYVGMTLLFLIIRGQNNPTRLVRFGDTQAMILPYLLLMSYLFSLRPRGMARVHKQLSAGFRPVAEEEPYRKAKRKHKIFYCLIPLLLVFLYGPLFLEHFVLEYDKPLAEIDHPIPIVELADIEDDPNFYYTDKHWRTNTPDSSGSVMFETSAGALVQYYITQYGVSNYSASLSLDYKEFMPYVSSNKYMEDWLDTIGYQKENGWIMEDLIDTPFDKAILAKKGNEQVLFLIYDQKWLEVTYVGLKNLAQPQYYDMFLSVLQQDYHCS